MAETPSLWRRSMDVEELERLEKARTQGEWRAFANDYFWEIGCDEGLIGDLCSSNHLGVRPAGSGTIETGNGQANAAFIAALANAAPDLLSRARDAERYEKALRVIAEGEGELMPIRDEAGGFMDAMPRTLRAEELRAEARAALSREDDPQP